MQNKILASESKVTEISPKLLGGVCVSHGGAGEGECLVFFVDCPAISRA
jgi:hypothetical protein